MRLFTDAELIALGTKVQEARYKGGRMVLEKFGKKHFSMLGKLSAEKRKANKLLRRTII